MSEKQVEYAATDAFVLLEIYDVIADPEKGLSQQQLQSLTYNYVGQKHQSSGPTPGDNIPDQPNSLADYADINTASKYAHSGPKPPAGAADDQQPAATADSGTHATTGSSRQSPGQADSRQPDSGQPRSDTNDNNVDDSDRHDGSGGSAPFQLLHQQRAEQSRMQHDATASLPAGSPLQDCLQRKKLQHVLKSIAPGTG